MGELMEYFKEKYGKKSSVSDEQILKTTVKNSILDLCDEKLQDANYVLVFEVEPKMLEYAVIVIEEEPLKSKYDINQISKTLFQASLKEVEI